LTNRPTRRSRARRRAASARVTRVNTRAGRDSRARPRYKARALGDRRLEARVDAWGSGVTSPNSGSLGVRW
jgi:hypothetical protein